MRRRTVVSLEQALSLSYATTRFVQLGWRVIRLEATPGRSGLPGDPNRYIGETVVDDDRRTSLDESDRPAQSHTFRARRIRLAEMARTGTPASLSSRLCPGALAGVVAIRFRYDRRFCLSSSGPGLLGLEA